MKTRSPLRILLKMFQDRFFENDTVSPGSGFETNIYQVLGFLLTVGFVATVFWMPAFLALSFTKMRSPASDWALRDIRLVLSALSFAVIGFTTCVRPHQIAGPDWLSMERFDIQAKLPEGASEELVPEMLRAMLAERFGMKTHMESRTVAAYALVVGKNGAKLQPSTLPPDAEPAKGLAALNPSTGGRLSSTGGPAGPTQITMGPNGAQLVMLKTKISALTDLLSSILGRPVVDWTGLFGVYQITLDIPQEDMQNVARALGMGGPAAASGAPSDPGGSSMFQAVEKFGLRLDSRKEQIETLVIDHIEKVPTAN